MKKTMSLILVLALVLSLFPVSVFAEEVPAVSLEVSAESVEEGQEVTVTLKLESKIEAICCAQWFVYYDSSYFQYDGKYANGTAIPNTQVSLKSVGMVKTDRDLGYGDNMRKVSIDAFNTSNVTGEPGVIGSITFLALTPTEANSPAAFSVRTDASRTSEDLEHNFPISDPENPVKVAVTSKPVAVTGIELDQTMINLVVGDKATLTATVSPDNASDKTVTWSSSNEQIATVTENGEVTAVSAGTAIITAMAGNAKATCYVAVAEKPEELGVYTVAMPEKTQVVAGESVQIPVTIAHTTGVKTYNAFDLSFTYDPAVLELVSTELEGLTVSGEAGTVRVQGYGADREVGSVPFELKFKAIGAGDVQVTLTSAKVDISGNAIDQDAPEALVTKGTTAVEVVGYPVTLPENFAGEAVAAPGKDYMFSIPRDFYDYAITVTVGNEEVAVTDNEDDSYTIPGEKVTGPIVVSAVKTGKMFNVTLGTDMSGEQKAQYMTAYTATLNREAGYSYDVQVSIGGEPYTGFAVLENQYIIPGEDITGEVVFQVEKTLIPVSTYTVSFEGPGAGDATGDPTAVAGGDYTFTLNEDPAYEYEVSAVMGADQTAVEITQADGKYTISNVTGDLVITVEKTAVLQVEVSQYVELDGKTVFLVTVKGSKEQKKAYTYDGNAMFYSEQYQAWCYLDIQESAFTAENAKAKIAMTETSFTTLVKTTDVNMSGLEDINDAQLVYDIYNGKYEDFTTVTMQRFLNADVNGDGVVNVTDAAAVVAAIR